MNLRLPITLALLVTTAAAQTTTTTHRTTTPRKTTTPTKTTSAKPATASTTGAATNAADNPPNVPKVEGTPKTLYSLRYIDVALGTGDLAQPRKYYTVHYTGWLTDGTKFDSSHDHPGGEPLVFPYGARRVIPGWDTGFEGMRIGGKRRLYIPYQLAYGESGRPPVIPPKADLIFDLEFLGQSDNPPAPVPPVAPEKPAEPAKPAEPPTPPTGATPPAPSGTATPQSH